MNEEKHIARVILNYYPDTQAIYLFGSFDTGDERDDSDVDIALLFHALCTRYRFAGDE